jgi:hypothetical protein
MFVRFMLTLSRYAAPLALLGVLASCDDDGGASPMEASDFCGAYVDALCDGFESCCGAGSSGSCRSSALRYCEDELLTLDDRGLAPTGPNVPARIVFDFDETSAGAAIARVKSSLASCDGSAALVTFADTHFLGEPGAECLRHEDCFEGMRCEQPPRAVFGTCVFAPLEGQACTDVCASSDLTCVEDRGDQVCIAPRKEGESCAQAPCESGLRCADTWIGGTGSDVRCEAFESSGSNWLCEGFAFDSGDGFLTQ